MPTRRAPACNGRPRKEHSGGCPGGRPPAARVAGRVVGQDRFAPGDHGAQQRLQVGEAQSRGGVVLIKPPHRLFPGDGADGPGLQDRPAGLVGQHLANKPILAIADAEQGLQHRLEDVARLAAGDEGGLRLRQGQQQVVAATQLLLMVEQLALVPPPAEPVERGHQQARGEQEREPHLQAVRPGSARGRQRDRGQQAGKSAGQRIPPFSSRAGVGRGSRDMVQCPRRPRTVLPPGSAWRPRPVE